MVVHLSDFVVSVSSEGILNLLYDFMGNGGMQNVNNLFLRVGPCVWHGKGVNNLPCLLLS
jgi:hypothetical protein